MKNAIKIILAIVIPLIVVLVAAFCVLRLCFNVDVFDRSGWTVTEAGRLRYQLYDGTPLEGWQTIDGTVYYFDPKDDYVIATGWIEDDGNRYYLDKTGAITTGWAQIDGDRYYFTDSGIMATGWLEQDSQRFYLAEDGAAAAGWVDLAEGRFYLDENGSAVTGWLVLGDSTYYLDEHGTTGSGWLDVDGSRYFFDDGGKMHTGWLDTEEDRYYLSETGAMATGWLDVDGKRYHLNESGVMTTGWYETEEGRYYFREDGVMAIGRVVVDGATRHFTSTGKYVVLVNRWNPVPEDYVSDLVDIQGFLVDASCHDAMEELVAACNAAGYSCGINSVYRSYEFQSSIWGGQVERYVARGYSREEAERVTSQSIAIPGTSEHQLGLAIDVACGNAAYAWLAQHSWEYGFILRYPYGKTEETGILYEPWHFRYVGTELAAELFELGLCMEEYMEMLTESAGYEAYSDFAA